MGSGMRSGVADDPILEALHSEVARGAANLSEWISHVRANDGIETLIELEAWLKGLCAFFDLEHLALSEDERLHLLSRSFAPEISAACQALEASETLIIELMSLGQDTAFDFGAYVEMRMRKGGALQHYLGRILEQATPMDSLALLLESVSDLRVGMGASATSASSVEAFNSFGRKFRRDLKSCRYIDMLLTQKFRPEYDQIQNPQISGMVRSIRDKAIRQTVSLVLLQLHRFLRYLALIRKALKQDRPLSRYLVLFSLFHAEMEDLAKLLRSGFANARSGDPLLNSIDLILHSLKAETRRVFRMELVGAAYESDPSSLYAKIENSHGLLRNCYQSSIFNLVQAFDRKVEVQELYPSMLEGLREAETLRRDLWDLHRFMADALDSTEQIDLVKVMERIGRFRESSLCFLMYRDWGEFERFSEALITAGNQVEIRMQMRTFVSFLEILVQEVSKRSVFRGR